MGRLVKQLGVANANQESVSHARLLRCKCCVRGMQVKQRSCFGIHAKMAIVPPLLMTQCQPPTREAAGPSGAFEKCRRYS